MIKENEKIDVLNYNQNVVSAVVSPHTSYTFEPSEDGITPTVIPMTLEEIKYLNNSNAFTTGLLRFDENRQQEVYGYLRINDWESILTNKAIEEILIHPTFEGLQKIVGIKDTAQFERVRSALHKIKFEEKYDVSVRVAQIVDIRYKELLRKQINTNIELTKKDIPIDVGSEELESMKAENLAMKEQMAQMQEMMAQLLAAQKSQPSIAATAESTTKKTRTKKSNVVEEKTE